MWGSSIHGAISLPRSLFLFLLFWKLSAQILTLKRGLAHLSRSTLKHLNTPAVMGNRTSDVHMRLSGAPTAFCFPERPYVRGQRILNVPSFLSISHLHLFPSLVSKQLSCLVNADKIYLSFSGLCFWRTCCMYIFSSAKLWIFRSVLIQCPVLFTMGMPRFQVH